MSITSKLKAFNRTELAVILFYAVTGIILLAFLPLTGFPPHLGLIGIVSLITAYSLFTKRGWAPWLVGILLVVITVFAAFTLYSVGASNILITVSMVVYLVFTWLFSLYLLLKRKPLP